MLFRSVGFAALRDGGEKLAVLQLDAVHRHRHLFNGKDEKIDVSKVDVSLNGIELQDREFFAAIAEGREPNSSVAQVLPCYQVLHDLERQLGEN